MRKVWFTDESIQDIRNALSEGLTRHGEKAMARYSRLIDQAVIHLREDAERVGVKSWDSERSRYHLRFSKHNVAVEGEIVKNPSHYLFFKVEGETVKILRLLHESSDFKRHL